jgi:hypothetical protein
VAWRVRSAALRMTDLGWMEENGRASPDAQVNDDETVVSLGHPDLVAIVGWDGALGRINLCSGFEIPGDVDDDDAAVAAEEQEQLEELRALVVEEVLPGVADDQLGDEDGDLALGVLLLDF